MAINFLYEEYKKNPSKIEDLLSKKIEISEKLDGSRFQVQANEGNSFTFFKRKDMSISKIDRTLSKYYEKAITHFENLSEDKNSQMPDGWRFGMEYFPNLHPVTIVYDRLPLNNLVLTDIQVKDPRDKTIDIITDKATLDKWADILEVEKPPIIFEGNLNDSQRRRILDFLNTPFNSLIQRFKTENFTSFVLNILNPELKSSFMHNDIDKDIDGLVFKFDGKESYKVSNPDIIKNKNTNSSNKPSDIYNLTLVILQEFILGLDFSKIILKETTFEERYIEFVCKVYNLFLNSPQYKKNFEKGVDFELPRFLTREETNVNFKFVHDPVTLNFLKISNTNRELFKILLASMRSHKKKPSGFFTKELIFHHNALVDKVVDYIEKDQVSGSIKEATFCSFKEFKSVFLTESDNWQEEFGKDIPEIETMNEDIVNIDNSEVVSFPAYNDIVKKPSDIVSRSLDVLNKLFHADIEEIASKKRKTKVCLIVGKFQPFHNGHTAIIADAVKESGCKVYLVVLNKRLSANSLSTELHKSMIGEIVNTDNNIHGCTFSNGRSLSEILRDLPENIDVQGYAGSADECIDIDTQSRKTIPSFPMTRHLSSKNVLQSIENEDYETYKKLVPKPLHNYFYKIKSEMA